MKLALIIIPWGILLNSCEYQLDSNNFKHRQQPDSTYYLPVEISPDAFPQVLDEPIMLKYKVLPNDLSLLGVRITVNDYLEYESANLEDSFLIHPHHYNEGTKILSIQFFTDSKSESLADITGYEAVVFGRDWEFYNPDWFYPGIEITHFFNDNGIFKLEWDTTSLPGFKKYRLYRKWDFFEPKVIAEFDDFYASEYYDWEYFGGTVEYWIEVETENGSATSRIVTAHNIYPRPEIMWVRDNDVQFYWNKSPFDKVVLGYELSFTNSDTTNAILFASDNPNDTTFLLDGVPANEIVWYRLRVKIQGPEPGQSVWSDFINRTSLTFKPRQL